METKICSTCKLEKSITDYNKDRGRVRGQRKSCHGLVSKIWKNSEKGKQTLQKYLETHKEQIAARKKEYYEAKKEQIYARKKEYRKTHKETISERGKIKVTCECGNLSISN